MNTHLVAYPSHALSIFSFIIHLSIYISEFFSSIVFIIFGIFARTVILYFCFRSIRVRRVPLYKLRVILTPLIFSLYISIFKLDIGMLVYPSICNMYILFICSFVYTIIYLFIPSFIGVINSLIY